MAKKQTVFEELMQLQDTLDKGPFGDYSALDKKKVRAAGYKGPIYMDKSEEYIHLDFLAFEKSYKEKPFRERLLNNASSVARKTLLELEQTKAKFESKRKELDDEIRKLAGHLICKLDKLDEQEDRKRMLNKASPKLEQIEAKFESKRKKLNDETMKLTGHLIRKVDRLDEQEDEERSNLYASIKTPEELARERK